MKNIAVLTGGGDAPGTNAAIRAIVRTGLNNGFNVFGVRYGYLGLITGNIMSLANRDVSGIIQQGGSILGNSHCLEVETEDGCIKALRTLHENKIDALIVIGGNGAQKGAYALSQLDYPIVGVAATINNDLYGSDVTIGTDTALNIALESIDRIKVTASSLQRVFIVEVMGQDCGYLALMTGIAGGAEAIVIPEKEIDPESIAAEVRAAYGRGKAHAIVVVAEGCRYNGERLASYFEEHHGRLGFELKVTILGHVQRGGSPTAFDRLLGTRLGVAAINYLANVEYGILVGQMSGKIVATPIKEASQKQKPLNLDLLNLVQVLAG